jgi:hypothetical protein
VSATKKTTRRVGWRVIVKRLAWTALILMALPIPFILLFAVVQPPVVLTSESLRSELPSSPAVSVAVSPPAVAAGSVAVSPGSSQPWLMPASASSQSPGVAMYPEGAVHCRTATSEP